MVAREWGHLLQDLGHQADAAAELLGPRQGRRGEGGPGIHGRLDLVACDVLQAAPVPVSRVWPRLGRQHGGDPLAGHRQLDTRAGGLDGPDGGWGCHQTDQLREAGAPGLDGAGEADGRPASRDSISTTRCSILIWLSAIVSRSLITRSSWLVSDSFGSNRLRSGRSESAAVAAWIAAY